VPQAAIRIDDKALRRATKGLKRLPRNAPAKLRPTVEKFALRIQGRAQGKTPVLGGHLKSSARTDLRTIGTSLTAVISFGGLAAAYAEVQHEREDFAHPKGGQAHYLYGSAQSAWNDLAQRRAGQIVAAKLARLAREAMRAGGAG